MKQAAIELQLNIKTKDDKIASLEEALNRANDKIETLRCDGQFLLYEKASLAGQLKRDHPKVGGQAINDVIVKFLFIAQASHNNLFFH